MQTPEAQDLIRLSDAELFHLLGELRVANRDTAHFTPPSIAELIETGKKYFADVREQMRNAICNDISVQNYLLAPDEDLDSVEMILASAAILSGFSWIPNAQALVLSAILARRGLKAYCKQPAQ